MSNVEGTGLGKGIVILEKVDLVASNKQQERAEELRELVDLGSEEIFNMFDMTPQTP